DLGNQWTAVRIDRNGTALQRRHVDDRTDVARSMQGDTASGARDRGGAGIGCVIDDRSIHGPQPDRSAGADLTKVHVAAHVEGDASTCGRRNRTRLEIEGPVAGAWRLADRPRGSESERRPDDSRSGSIHAVV